MDIADVPCNPALLLTHTVPLFFVTKSKAPYVPAVTPLFFNVAAIVLFALPSNVVLPVTSPLNASVLAVVNLRAFAVSIIH